ncbi:MAG: hypothetical protein HYZ65_16270 [Burkholderiales bacterium]|nr:hypothetical protein [Burkholderiales bacterium]
MLLQRTICVFLLYFALGAGAQELVLTYPNLNGNGRNNFGYRVLDLALKKHAQAYRIALSDFPVNDERARAMLDADEISVTDFGSGVDFERAYSAVYFPIDQGLLGYRLALIHSEKQAAFNRINNLHDLQAYVAGQGLGWSDNIILKNAGIPLRTAPALENLFPMLEYGRFDWLPLGLNEVYGYAQQYRSKAPHIVVDTHLILIYPFARLFYVKKGNTALRDIILDGLQKAFADGSFQELLRNEPSIKNVLDQAGLKQRVQIRVANPIASDEFKRMPASYFFKLDDRR